MKLSISFKLFILTSVFLIIFVSGSIFFQSLFFQQFYINRKIETYKSNMESFKQLYINNSRTSLSSSSIMQRFEDTNNAKLVIITSSGDFKYVTNYITGKQDISNINIINRILNEWFSNPAKFSNIKTSGKPVIYTDNSEFGIKNIVLITPVTLSDNAVDVIFSVSSLQPITEASVIIKEFYIYFFIGAVLIIIILSLIYSNMISKPLVALNKAASKMAELDFSSEFPVETNDEIGSLGKTLNFLSGNLNNALISLNESNEKLKQDIEKERSLERMRKEFVAGVSHELKTPISLIEGYAEGLKDNIVEGEDKDYYLDVIIDEAKQMGDLVSDMLDLSHLESGTYKLALEQFNLSDLLTPLQKKFSNMAKEKQLHFHLMLQDDLKVTADKKRTDQVLTNFITNAIKHTPENGNITAKVSLEKEHVRVEIENEGSNISAADIDNIWDRFYKIDKSRNRDAGGTGLGLAIVKNILQLNGSSYGVENTEKGVRFYFTLQKAT